jgi:hypothetical protein
MTLSCSLGQEWLGSSVKTVKKLGKAVVVAFDHRLMIGVAARLIVLE